MKNVRSVLFLVGGARRELQACFRRVVFKLKFRRHIFSEGKVKVIRHFTFSNFAESNRLNGPAMMSPCPYALSLVFLSPSLETSPETSPEASLHDKPRRNSKTFVKKPQN